MFCPNCGKDCADAKFCPECGIQIQAVKKDTVWQVGMACPHCGGTKLDGNNCAFCGAQLIADVSVEGAAEKDSYEIPYGSYRGTSDRIEFARDFIVVHKKVLFKKVIAKIRYDQLVEVIYGRDEKEIGHMSFRWNDDGSEKKVTIYFSVRYGAEGYEIFFHLFTVIKLLSPATAIFSLDIPASDAQQIDFDAYFNRFSPYRRRAADALMREYALTKKVATAMINTEFEIRQMDLYADIPALAVRDMNCVKAERHRLIEELIREIDERQALNRHR